MTQAITTAMILAAGLGSRMRPITNTLPKPLVRVGGKALMDWTLDEFAKSGVTKAVVNVHHLAPLICAHVSARKTPSIVIPNFKIIQSTKSPSLKSKASLNKPSLNIPLDTSPLVNVKIPLPWCSPFFHCPKY